jgi:hypothetical protein
MSMEGMNIEAVRTIATGLTQNSQSLRSCISQIDRMVNGIEWQGNDAQQFRSSWSGEHRPLMSQAALRLATSASELRKQADQQEAASNSLGYTAGGGSGGGHGRSAGPNGVEQFFGTVADWTLGGIGDTVEWTHDRLEDVTEGLSWTGARVAEGVQWTAQTATQGAQWTAQTAAQGAQWTAQTAAQGAAAVAHGAQVLGQATWNSTYNGAIGAARISQAEGGFWMHTASEIVTGHPLQQAELASHQALVGMLGAGMVANVLTGTDNKFGAQGKPIVGAPTVVPNQAGPTDFNGLADEMRDAYDSGGVRVTAVHGADGTTRYIVACPGTQANMGNITEGWSGNPNGRDWPANLWQMSTGDSAYSQGVRDALDKAIAQDRIDHPNSATSARPEILLMGHSQGGLIAANLASDSSFANKYDIKGVVTEAAPIDCAEVPWKIPVMSIQHTSLAELNIHGDIVPLTDFRGNDLLGVPEIHPNYTKVELGAPSDDPMANHAQDLYAKSVHDAQGSQRAAFENFESKNNLSNFYGSNSTTYDTPVTVGFR